jgi:hypothetical protein
LASSKFLGFFDLGLFVFGGTDLGFFSLNIITLITAFMSRSPLIINKFVLPIYFTVICLILWGVFNPVLNQYESIMQGVVASKSFLYFSLLFYLFGRKNNININLLVKFLKFIGCYLTFVLFLSSVIGVGPPSYSEEYEGYASYVRVFYPTFISLAIFLFYADWLNKNLKGTSFFVIFALLFIALVLAGHFSLTLSTLFSLGSIYILWHRKTKINFFKLFHIIMAIAFILTTVFVSSKTLRVNTVTTLNAIFDGSDVALSSRKTYNKFRWEAINQKPYFGYGFIHKDAPIMARFEASKTNRFMMSLGVIDSGYIDLFVRFGYIGSAFYLCVIAFYILKTFRRKQHFYYSLVMSAFLFQYYLVNYTWSVFSYAHGIIPMILALYILFHSEKQILK